MVDISNYTSFAPAIGFEGMLSMDQDVVNTYKSGGSFDKSPLNVSSFVPFIRISTITAGFGGQAGIIELNRPQLADREGDPASTYAFRGTVGLESVKVSLYNMLTVVRNTIDIVFKVYHAAALSKLKDLFMFGSTVQVDFGWSRRYFDSNNSNPGNVHAGDGMTIFGAVKDFSISYDDNLIITVTLNLIDVPYYALDSVYIDYYDLVFDNSQGKKYSECFSNAMVSSEVEISTEPIDISDTSQEFLKDALYFSFDYILKTIAETVNKRMPGATIRFVYSNINPDAKNFVMIDNSKQGLGDEMVYGIGNIAIPFSKLVDFRYNKEEVRSLKDFLQKIIDYINTLSGYTINLSYFLKTEKNVMYISDLKFLDGNENSLASEDGVGVLSLRIGSKDSIVKRFNLSANFIDSGMDAVWAVAPRLAYTPGYVFSVADINRYRKFFFLEEDIAGVIPSENNSAAIFKIDASIPFNTGIKPDGTVESSVVNEKYIFIMSKKGITVDEVLDSLNTVDKETVSGIISQGSLNALDYSPFHGGITLRGLSGIYPIHMIQLEGTGNSNWNTIYRITQVTHNISKEGWETDIEAIMAPPFSHPALVQGPPLPPGPINTLSQPIGTEGWVVGGQPL